MEQSNPVRLRVQLTVQDVYRAHVALMPRIVRAMYWIVGSLAIFGVAFITHIAEYGHRRPEAGSAFIPVLPIIFLAAFVPIARFAIPHLTAKQAMKNPGMKEGSEYTFAPDGIRIVSSTGRSELTWQAVAKVRETECQFLLYPQPNIAHILPKRCFSSEAEIAAFRTLVSQHVHKIELRG